MSNDWGNDWNTEQWNNPSQTADQWNNPSHNTADQWNAASSPPQQNSQTFQGYGTQPSYSMPNQFNAGYSEPTSGSSQSFGGFQPQQLMSDPMLNAAKQFGGQFAEQQKEKITKYLGGLNLKYYFSVDNSYVGKKLAILLFPFIHQDWSVQFSSQSQPATPREDVNAPDLYIPLMAFLTYVLVSGFVLGTQGRFSPEILGILTSNAFIWVVLENIVIFISKYVMNISSALSLWHSLAYSTYKFAHMIICLVVFMIGDKTFYYCALAYTSIVLVVFLLKSVSHFMLNTNDNYDEGRKRKLILVLFLVVTQPLIMWWLTSGASSYDYGKYSLAQMALNKMGGMKNAPSVVPMTEDGDIDYEALLKMPKGEFESMN